jgi:transcription termination/antitermination protein NusG
MQHEGPLADQDSPAPLPAVPDEASTPPSVEVPPTPMEAGAPLLTPLAHPAVPPNSEGAFLDETSLADQPALEEAAAGEAVVQEDEAIEEEPAGSAEPLEFIDETIADADLKFDWFILKVQVNREDSIKDALLRRVKMNGLDRFFKDIVVPTEDIAEFTKTGKRRVVKKKLYPGYILVNMAVNDDSWFMVRETPGIGDFTGSAGKPTPMEPRDVERILRSSKVLPDVEDPGVKTAIPFNKGDRVRVKEGYFQNFEGDVESIDQAHGRVTVMITIFGRPTPVEIEHWQIEKI